MAYDTFIQDLYFILQNNAFLITLSFFQPSVFYLLFQDNLHFLDFFIKVWGFPGEVRHLPHLKR